MRATMCALFQPLGVLLHMNHAQVINSTSRSGSTRVPSGPSAHRCKCCCTFSSFVQCCDSQSQCTGVTITMSSAVCGCSDAFKRLVQVAKPATKLSISTSVAAATHTHSLHPNLPYRGPTAAPMTAPPAKPPRCALHANKQADRQTSRPTAFELPLPTAVGRFPRQRHLC